MTDQAWTPFATVGDIVLTHPAARVERIGFHESNHEGAQQLAALPTAVSPVTMDARERLTSGATAADVVIDPAAEVRAPVTGRVKRAGGYGQLACDEDPCRILNTSDPHTYLLERQLLTLKQSSSGSRAHHLAS